MPLFNNHFLLSLFTAAGLCMLLLARLPRVAKHIGLTDDPDDRKHHEGKIPLIGGIAMFVAFSFSVLLLDMPIGYLRGLFAGAMLLVIVGVLDDLHELSSAARFIAQILAVIFMAEWSGVRLIDLGWISPSGGLVQLNWWSSLLTIFAAVGVMNAVNMIDGVDGLAGSVSLIAVVSMALLAYLSGDIRSARILILLSTVILVFLFFNFSPSNRWQQVFMGDAGSMFLGFVLCWFFIQLSQAPDRIMAPVTALWIFFVPLIDTVTQMFRRVLKGQSPFTADREHVHHILMARDYSDRKTVAILLTISIGSAIAGVASDLYNVSQALMFYLFLACFAIYFLFSCYSKSFKDILRG